MLLGSSHIVKRSAVNKKTKVEAREIKPIKNHARTIINTLTLNIHILLLLLPSTFF